MVMQIVTKIPRMTDKAYTKWKLTVQYQGRKMDVISSKETSQEAQRQTLKRFPQAQILDVSKYKLKVEKEEQEDLLSGSVSLKRRKSKKNT
jgi:hypothetical protein